MNNTIIYLKAFDLIVINSSGGKDSLCSLFYICYLATLQGYDKKKIVVSHQILKEEWPGTKELVQEQVDRFGVSIEYSRRRNKDGYEETLLEYVRRRGKWPSSTERYCTSDFKRGPGARVITKLTKDMEQCTVLHIFGFRKEESPARSKKISFELNQRLTTKKRKVYDFLPIHDWIVWEVWLIILLYKLPYHLAYDLGIPRLSCIFCIFSPFDVLVIAGYKNPELLDEYIQVEEEIGHDFKYNAPIRKVKEAIEAGYKPKVLEDWRM